MFFFFNLVQRISIFQSQGLQRFDYFFSIFRGGDNTTVRSSSHFYDLPWANFSYKKLRESSCPITRVRTRFIEIVVNTISMTRLLALTLISMRLPYHAHLPNHARLPDHARLLNRAHLPDSTHLPDYACAYPIRRGARIRVCPIAHACTIALVYHRDISMVCTRSRICA